MQKLWSCKDFVDKLSYPAGLVRAWAYRILRDRFPRRFTPEITLLIKDPDEYLSSVAPKYLSDHKATEFALAILQSFLEGKGNVPGNCAMAGWPYSFN